MKAEEKATLYISKYPDGTIGFSEVAEGEYIVEEREITLEYANQQPEEEGMIEYKDAFECPKCDSVFKKQPKQPEVDHVKDFHTWRLPHEKQPEQGEVDALAEKLHDEYQRLSYIGGWSTQKDCQVGFENLPDANQRVMRKMAEFVLSTNQDKVRELLLDFAKWYDEELPEDEIVELHVTNYLSSKSTKPKQRCAQEQNAEFKVWDDLFGILAWKFLPTKSGDMMIDSEEVYNELKDKFELKSK